MKTRTTRTLNPLPFQDMEPHRFEDLVRQLAYDMRPWKALEAVGRAGSDEGIDIRGIEAVPVTPDDESEPSAEYVPPQENLWIFQCKREKSLAAKRLRAVIDESLVSLASPPHGFVLAVACDVTKKSRDAFRDEMVRRRIQHFELWTRGELEDLLFQPKNDRLLFAYFGISLTTRRRAMTSEARAEIAKKKQLDHLLNGKDRLLIALRDPADGHPPLDPSGAWPTRRILCYAVNIRRPGYLMIVQSEHLAATTPLGDRWDALFEYDLLREKIDNDLRDQKAFGTDKKIRLNIVRATREETPLAQKFHDTYIPPRDRTHLKIIRYLSLDRILAIDPIGDGYHPVPHILVDFGGADPFDPIRRYILGDHEHNMRPCAMDTRVEIYPQPLPLANHTPERFDQTDTTNAALSDPAGAELGGLLDAIAAARHTAPEIPASDTTVSPRVPAKIQEFLKWRADVALPTLSGFVEKLRAAGHTARVSVYSRPGTSYEAVESISLHTELNFGDSWHRSRSVVSISAAENEWHVHVDPPAPAPYGDRSGSRNRTPLQELSTLNLEAVVLEVLTRLGKDFANSTSVGLRRS